MISQNEFIQLSTKDKIRMLYQHGAFVLNIRYYGYKINLYSLNNFYVEVFYNHKLDQIEKIEPLRKSKSREKFYLDQIRLPKNLFK